MLIRPLDDHTYLAISVFNHLGLITSSKTAKTVNVSLIQSKLDYCNSLYLCLPNGNNARLQLAKSAIEWVVTNQGDLSPCTNTPRREHISSSEVSPLAVSQQRIIFEVMTINHSLLHSNRPRYLFDLLGTTSTGRTSSATFLTLRRHPIISKRKLVDRSFQYAIPVLWNSLPADMRQIDPVECHSSRSILSHKQFRRRLKTHLFQAPYPT